VEIGKSAGKSYAYLLGVYLGDGCVTKPSPRSAPHRLCFKLNTIDEDFAEATKAALENLTDHRVSVCEHSVKKSSKPNFSLYCGDDALCAKLIFDTARKTRLPNFTMRESEIAFIEGLMDSEGFVAANSNPTNRRYYMGFKCCDPWVRDFQRLLEIAGIRTGKFATEKPRKPGYKAPSRFHIKMQSWVDSGARFNIARKQSRVDEWASAGPYERRARYPRRLPSEANTLDAR